MLLYWAMFTLGFWAGAILTFVVFAPKNPKDDQEYGTNVKYPAKPRRRSEIVEI